MFYVTIFVKDVRIEKQNLAVDAIGNSLSPTALGSLCSAIAADTHLNIFFP